MFEIIVAFMAGVVMGIGVTRGTHDSVCPRELMGYAHRVNGCDHSDAAKAAAYAALYKRKGGK